MGELPERGYDLRHAHDTLARIRSDLLHLAHDLVDLHYARHGGIRGHALLRKVRELLGEVAELVHVAGDVAHGVVDLMRDPRSELTDRGHPFAARDLLV